MIQLLLLYKIIFQKYFGLKLTVVTVKMLYLTGITFYDNMYSKVLCID
jgi:hypothetical protein